MDMDNTVCEKCQVKGGWTSMPADMPGAHYMDYTHKCGHLVIEQTAHDDDCPQRLDPEAKCRCGFK